MKKMFPALLLSVVLLAGCAGRGPYHAAVVIEHDAVTIVGAFQRAETDEFNASHESLEEHQKLEGLIEKVGLAGQTVNHALQAGESQQTVLGDIKIMVQAVSDLNTNGILGVKNAQAQAVLTTALNAIKALLQNLQTEVGAAQTTTGAKP